MIPDSRFIEKQNTTYSAFFLSKASKSLGSEKFSGITERRVIS
jgi:hypothetical protein